MCQVRLVFNRDLVSFLLAQKDSGGSVIHGLTMLPSRFLAGLALASVLVTLKTAKTSRL